MSAPALRALILCSHERFGRLLENELLRMGLAPDVASALPADTGVYAVLLVDTESVSLPDGCSLPTVLLGRASDDPSCGDGHVYLRRPFALPALEDAVRRLIEDAPPPAPSVASLLTLRPDGKAFLSGRPLSMTPGEAAVLGCLLEQKGSPVSRETLATLLGGGGNIVDVYICKLRTKIEKPLGRRIIHTERGVGYRMDSSLFG